jgi:urate oxidase
MINTYKFFFSFSREGVKGIILDTFAGPASTGVFSPSVQNTLYLTERNVLSTIPQVPVKF